MKLKECTECNRQLTKKQKVYCSRKCQSLGVAKQNTKSNIIELICSFCNKNFKRKISKSLLSKQQKIAYCKRKCKDLHQKDLYRGEGNPYYGKKWSDVTRQKHMEAIADYWSLQENKTKHNIVMLDVSRKLGYWPGTSNNSIEKRKNTCNIKYGVSHPWMNSEIRLKCEKTSLAKYGLNTWEIAKSSIIKKNTNIETKIKQLLDKLGVKFKQHYVVCSGDIRREFDFFVYDFNTLIEADGDYFHANPNLYLVLDEIQKATVKNDLIKNKLAQDLSLRLLRFWESDIKSDTFFDVLKEKLYEKV